MKIFGTGATPFSPQGADIPEGDPQELKFVTDQFQNSVYGELFNFIASQGITPTSTTGADLKQIKKAVLSTVLSSNVYLDSGTANNKILTHQAGSDFSYKLINTLKNGFSLKFVNKVENTGAVQITVYDAENAANLTALTNIPVFREDGSTHEAGSLRAGDLVYCFYYASPNPRFVAYSTSARSKIFNSDDVLTTGRALTANDINKHLVFGGTADAAFSLPLANSVPSGSMIFVRGGAGGIATFNISGSNTINIGSNPAVTSCTCFGSEVIMLVSNGVGDWRLTKINPRQTTTPYTVQLRPLNTSFTNSSRFIRSVSIVVNLSSNGAFVQLSTPTYFREFIGNSGSRVSLEIFVKPGETYSTLTTGTVEMWAWWEHDLIL